MVAISKSFGQQFRSHKEFKEPTLMENPLNVVRAGHPDYTDAPVYDNSVGEAFESSYELREAFESSYELRSESGEKQVIKLRRDFVYGTEQDIVKISIRGNETKPEHPSSLQVRHRQEQEMLLRYRGKTKQQEQVANGILNRRKQLEERNKWTPFQTYKIKDLPKMLKYRLAMDFAPKNPALVNEASRQEVENESNRFVYELVK